MGLRVLARTAEDWWFDRTRSIETSQETSLDGLKLAGEACDGFRYLPVRVTNARAALRELPVDLTEYTFVDLGSGRGRMLFVAAEFGFRRIVGVEFAAELHECARRNIARYRCARQRCRVIESVNVNALDYEFPDAKLVIYLFNPFGADVFGRVLANLRRSLEEHWREVFIVLIYPELAPVAAAFSWLRIVRETPRYHVYEAV